MESSHKWLPWLLFGGIAVVGYMLFSGAGSSSGGLAQITQAAPDTTASDQARYGFLSSAIGGLLQIQQEDLQGQYGLASQSLTDQYQLSAIQSTVSGQVAAAQAQAQADIASAKASTVGKHGLKLGPLSFTW